MRQAQKQRPLKLLVINDGYRLAPWADMLYACDAKWWNWHGDDVLDTFQGRTLTQDIDAAKQFGVEYIYSVGKTGLSVKPGTIHQGLNSGYQAINIAFLEGAKRIILIGYDMRFADDGRAHWFGEHPDKIRSSYDGFIANYVAMKPHAEMLGLEIINATPGSALHCFRKLDLSTALV